MRRLLRCRILLLAVLLSCLQACSDAKTQSPSSGVASPVVTPLSTSAVPASVLVSGSPIQVLVYVDSEKSSMNCMDLLPDMVPMTAPPTTPSKAATCNFEAEQVFRVHLNQRPDLILQLSSVEILVPVGAGFPTAVLNVPTCQSLDKFLIPGDLPPQAATYVSVCSIVPPVRGSSSSSGGKMIWAQVPESDLLPTAPLPCWRLAAFLDIRGARRSRYVTCLL
jgi:hypothetical protein